MDLPHPRSFSLKVLLLDVTVNLIEFIDGSIKLLLLLLEGGLAGEDVGLALALIFFLLVRGLLIPQPLLFYDSVATKQALPSPHHLVNVRVGLNRAMARSSSSRLRTNAG